MSTLRQLSRLSLWCLWLLVSCRDPEPSGTSTIPPPQAPQNTFTNPLLNAGPDPWVIRHDGWYYYTHTTGNSVRLWKTRKMSELAAAEAKTVWQPSAGRAFSQNVWAPELHRLDNRWYVYVTAGSGDNATQRLWVLENTATDPLQGEWTLKGQLTTDADNSWAIDASVFDYNGQRYVTWSGWEGRANVQQNIYIARLGNPWTVEGSRVRISSPDFDWERVGSPLVNEAPQALQRNGRLFISYSAPGCWTDDYSLGLLTLKAGGDPLRAADWQKSPQPVFTKSPEARAYGPGHNAFFQSPDGKEDWFIYHANPQPGQGCADFRSPRMQRLTWTADGMPQFGQPVPVLQPVQKPSGE